MQTKIHKNTFKGCSNLKYIKLPNNISAIDDCAFQNCSSLIDVEMGTNVTFIGLSAFQNDTSLISVDRFSDDDPSHAFDMVGNYAFANTGLKNINLTLNSSTINTFWGDNCFEKCINLTDVHILSASYLSKEMFKDCTSLKNVEFKNDIMGYMYPRVFENCTSLKDIKLPSKALYIAEEIFKNCTNLLTVGFNKYTESNVKLIQKNAFNGCNNLIEINIPSSIDKSELIEDAALSNSTCLHIIFHGMQTDQFGIGVKQDIDINYATPFQSIHYSTDPYSGYTYWDANFKYGPSIPNIIQIFKQAAYYNIPVVCVIDFYFQYWPNCKWYIAAPHNGTIIDLTGKDNVIVDDNKTYDFSDKKYIILPIHICFGTLGMSVTGIPDISGVDVDVALESFLHNSYKNKNNPNYNILTKLYNMGIFEMISINTASKRKSFGVYMHLIFKWDKNDINTINTITDNVNIRKLTSSSSYDFLFSKNNDSETIKNKIFIAIYKKLRNYIAKNNEKYGIVPNIPFHPSDNVKSNAFFRLLNKTNPNVKISTLDSSFSLVYDVPKKWRERQYQKPTVTESDKETTNNFDKGKWYYNSEQIYNYARQNNTPCLFIYSMLGCGPCQIYLNNIWNNSNFQEWVKTQNFYFCSIECNCQPFYDEHLQFVSDLALSALNVNNNPTHNVTPNAMGETFSRLMTPILIFMDKDGKCYIYSYHDIDKYLDSWGIDAEIKRLQSLCLYHFDNNNHNTAEYVKNAIPFILGNYKPNDPDNILKVDDNLYSFDKINLYSIDDVNNDILKCLENNGVTNGLYLGGCIISYIEYFNMFNLPDDHEPTADEYNEIFSTATFIIGDKCYKLQIDPKDNKRIKDICNFNSYVYIYKIIWQPCDWPI